MIVLGARTQTVARGADGRVRRAFGRRGFAHLPWMAAIALELQALGRGVVQGASHRGEPGDGAPRAPSPGLLLEEAASDPSRERLRRVRTAKAHEARRCPFDGGEGGIFLLQDETRLETNPKVGLCWMRKGKQRRLRTPGTNRKVWISGALNFSTGRFHWVTGERKNGELFIQLLEKLRRTYRAVTRSCTCWPWTTTRAMPADGSRST